MWPDSWESFERRHLVLTVVRAFGTGVLVLVAYFVVPISNHPHGSIVVRLSVGLTLFAAFLVHEIRAIAKSDRPILRAVDAMALLLPAFIVVFAWTFLTMSISQPDAFSQPLSRVSALYFTVTVFSTVGFGDIVPSSDPARVAVMVQMVGDVIFIAVVLRLIVEVARGSFNDSARAARDESA